MLCGDDKSTLIQIVDFCLNLQYFGYIWHSCPIFPEPCVSVIPYHMYAHCSSFKKTLTFYSVICFFSFCKNICNFKTLFVWNLSYLRLQLTRGMNNNLIYLWYENTSSVHHWNYKEHWQADSEDAWKVIANKNQWQLYSCCLHNWGMHIDSADILFIMTIYTILYIVIPKHGVVTSTLNNLKKPLYVYLTFKSIFNLKCVLIRNKSEGFLLLYYLLLFKIKALNTGL